MSVPLTDGIRAIRSFNSSAARKTGSERPLKQELTISVRLLCVLVVLHFAEGNLLRLLKNRQEFGSQQLCDFEQIT